ncbi:hypothetical protein J2W42_006443 [Rhizobium tibeticum]|nr:hypothetical protein [Rhizobium tibeticum]
MLKMGTDRGALPTSRQPDGVNDNHPLDEAEELLQLLQGVQRLDFEGRHRGYALPAAPPAGFTQVDFILSACIVSISLLLCLLAYFYV